MANLGVAAIILAAGKGTRMKSELHKVLHPIGNKPMVLHLTDQLEQLGAEKQVMVVGAGREQVERAVSGAEFVVQEPQLGTGHAVMMAKDALKGFSGTILILYGDVPLVPQSVLTAMIEARSADDAPSLVVLGFKPLDTGAYGRLVTAEDGSLERIVEFKDASEIERAINFCNSGIMAVDGSKLFDYLDATDNDNAASEYYLTDIVAIARAAGDRVVTVEASEADVMGVNSRAELAVAENIFQNRARAAAMAAGATLIDPLTVYFSTDTVLGHDVVVEPNVYFGPGVKVGNAVRINAFSHIQEAKIADDCQIGPFARLRPGADLHEGAKVGNFCEVKKATIEAGAKVNHLSYIGDATVGAKANIGAGTITCNYDGFNKYQTTIGAGAFIGSNTALVAPVTVGAGAIVGAGSVVTKDVDADALALTRSKHKELSGWAKRFRDTNKK